MICLQEFQILPDSSSDRSIHGAVPLGLVLSSGNYSDLPKLVESEAVSRTVESRNLLEYLDGLSIESMSHKVFGRLMQGKGEETNCPEDDREAAHSVEEVPPPLVLGTGTSDSGVRAGEVRYQR